MKTKQAVTHFGSEAAVAKVLSISRQAVHKWEGLIPIKRALELNKMTGGKLRLHLRDYR